MTTNNPPSSDGLGLPRLRKEIILQLKFRRVTYETVDLNLRRCLTCFAIRITAPASLKGSYIQIGGSWRWLTETARDAALKDIKGQLKQLREENEENTHA